MRIMAMRHPGYVDTVARLNEMAALAFARIADRWREEALAAREDGDEYRYQVIHDLETQLRINVVRRRLGGGDLTPAALDGLAPGDVAILGSSEPTYVRMARVR